LSTFGGSGLAGDRGGVGDGPLEPEVGQFLRDGQGVLEGGVGSEGVGALSQSADAAGEVAGPSGSPAEILELNGLNRDLLEVIAEFTQRERRGPTTDEALDMLREKTGDETLGITRVYHLTFELRVEKWLTGKIRGVHDLSDKGREFFGLPAASEITLSPRQQVFLEVIAEFTQRERRGPTTKEAVNMLRKKTGDERWNKPRVSQVVCELRGKDMGLMVDKVRGILDLSDKGRELFGLPVGGGAGGPAGVVPAMQGVQLEGGPSAFGGAWSGPSRPGSSIGS
jgi:hypothetical protein